MAASSDRFKRIQENLNSRVVMPKNAPELRLMREALKVLPVQYPKDLTRNILVAGTNGKGSVSKALEVLLLSAGQSVGLYTSPHLVHICERFRHQGRCFSEAEFCEAFEAVDPLVEKFDLSHFEMLTAMAVWSFHGPAGRAVNWAIYEVGLGGLWDATNAIPHETAIITAISYDHQNILGSDLRDIARNKLGIVPRRGVVVHAPFQSELLEEFAEARSKSDVHWIERKPFDFSVKEGPRFELNTPWGICETDLAGARGAENVALALTTFEALGFDPEKHIKAVKEVGWPGRMQRHEHQGWPCPVYFSGDHNVQGIESLLELLRYYRWNHLHILVGIGEHKEAEGMLSRLSTLPRSAIYLTQTPFQGRTLSNYGDWPRRVAVAENNPEKALDQIHSRARDGDLVLVTGSLYLVGEAMKILKVNPFPC